MHPLLATDYSGFNEVLVGVALLVLGLTLFSLWPAAHGHWASVIFAVPSFVFGVLLLSIFSGLPSGLALITLTLLPFLAQSDRSCYGGTKESRGADQIFPLGIETDNARELAWMSLAFLRCLRAVIVVVPLLLVACATQNLPDHLTALQQKAAAISVDLSDGVSELEAYKIAGLYLGVACGVIAVPVEEKTEWRIEAFMGLAGMNIKTVFVDKQTGACRVVDHAMKALDPSPSVSKETKPAMPRLTEADSFPEKYRDAIRAISAALPAGGGKPDEYFAAFSAEKAGVWEFSLKHQSHPADASGWRGDPCGRCRIAFYDSNTGKVLKFQGIR